MQQTEATAERHPAFFSLRSLALIAPLCVVGAIIGTQLIVTLGITTNTSLIGALAGMGLARIPLLAFARYRSIHMQNLAQIGDLGRRRSAPATRCCCRSAFPS